MSTRRAVAVIAAVLLAIGVFVGLSPITVRGDTSCGSAFMPATGAAEAKTVVADVTDDKTAPDYLALCNDALNTRRWIAVPLAGLGAIAGLFLLLTNASDRRSDAATASRSPRAPR